MPISLVVGALHLVMSSWRLDKDTINTHRLESFRLRQIPAILGLYREYAVSQKGRHRQTRACDSVNIKHSIWYCQYRFRIVLFKVIRLQTASIIPGSRRLSPNRFTSPNATMKLDNFVGGVGVNWALQCSTTQFVCFRRADIM